jgi:Dna[CI] antecedent, DciA
VNRRIFVGAVVGIVAAGIVRPRRAESPQALAAIVAAWPGVVGRDVVSACQPVDLQGGVLVVRTATAPWAHQLAFLEHYIVSELAPHGVTRLRFRVAAKAGLG